MGKRRLELDLVTKVARRQGIKEKSVIQMVSGKARQLGVSSPTALLDWARNLKLGTTSYYNRMPPEQQAEFRSLGRSAEPARRAVRAAGNGVKKSLPKGPPTERGLMAQVVPALLQHQQLRDYCSDLLSLTGRFDRVVSAATTVLETRLRELTGERGNIPNIVAIALHPDRAMFRVSADNNVQEGFFFLVRGVFSVFRNESHHTLSTRLSRWDALKVCCLIDYLLTTIETVASAAAAPARASGPAARKKKAAR